MYIYLLTNQTDTQVQLRHKERQLEQKEASGQQEVSTLTEKVESLNNMLEEEHAKLIRLQVWYVRTTD